MGARYWSFAGAFIHHFRMTQGTADTKPFEGPGAREQDAALTQDSATLRELDHRVKNNLQLIASLILMQSRQAREESARAALKSALSRVTAVATVHRRLFQGDPSSFEVAEFVRDLTSDFAASAGRDDLKIVLELDPVVLPATSAAAFALVASELFDNALKHAFPFGRPGRIAVSLAGRDADCILTIADDGVGADGQPPGFGSTIVRLLCRQLHADLQITDTRPGTRATLTVPITPVGPPP